MKEAILYEKLEGGKVRCTACRQNCTILPGHAGVCGVRQNRKGRLYLLVYGKAAAVNIDPIEKKPLFHFLPGSPIFSLGTIGCNFACSFCQNWDISQTAMELKARLMKEGKMSEMGIEAGKYGYELGPERIVELCIQQRIPSIAYTYNEPSIFFEYIYDTARLAHKKGIKNVLVTNGYESDAALQMLRPYVQAMNIDLKSFSEEFYAKTCKAKLGKVLETIKAAHKLGYWLEITTLVIPGKNDSEQELMSIAEFLASVDKNMPWHVTAFHPDYKMTDTPSTSYAALAKAWEIGKKSGLRHVYVGNVLDDEHENTSCPNCNATLIKRQGYHVTTGKFSKGKCLGCGEKLRGVWE